MLGGGGGGTELGLIFWDSVSSLSFSRMQQNALQIVCSTHAPHPLEMQVADSAFLGLFCIAHQARSKQSLVLQVSGMFVLLESSTLEESDKTSVTRATQSADSLSCRCVGRNSLLQGANK